MKLRLVSLAWFAVAGCACGVEKSTPVADATTSADTVAAIDTDSGADTGAASVDAASVDAAGLSVQFPKGFLWGGAIAGFQCDMGCPTLAAAECEDTKSDWYQWVTDPVLVKDPATFNKGDPPSEGPGFWETWPKYMDAMQADMHLNALRTSIEWSRIFPHADAEKATTVAELDKYADAKAVAKYHQTFQGAIKRKIALLVTLNHYTLPLWIHDGKACHLDIDTCKNRGWVDKARMLKAIALYSGWCAKEFGGEVDLWGTINEPFAIVVPGYLLPTKERTNPPGLTLQADMAVGVLFALMEGHARMYDAVHANDKQDADGDGKAAQVGIVANLAAVTPADPKDPASVAVTPHADYVYNKVFLNAVIHGDVDENLDGEITANEKRPDMKARMDYIGINYYTQLKVKAQAVPLFPQYKLLDFLPDSNLFSNYPAGLYEVCKLAATYKLPMIITENGTADDKSKSFEGFLKPHLAALHKAIGEGADVRGYFYWSLMDNYEWNHGLYAIRMGLYDVDNKTKAFTLSGLGKGYGTVAAKNGW